MEPPNADVQLDDDEATTVLFTDAAALQEPLETPPLDKRGTAYGIFFLLGMGILLPWVTIITAVDYFTLQYPHSNFEFNITVAYMYPLVISMFLVVRWGWLLNSTLRIVCGYALFLVTLLIVPFTRDALPESAALGVTLLLIAVLGIADAVAQGTLYGIAACFPAVYIQAVASGNGMAGVLVSVTRVVTKRSFPETVEGVRGSTILFFLISASLVILCIVGYVVLLRMPFAKFYLRRSKPEDQQGLTGEELTDRATVDSPGKVFSLNSTATYIAVMKKIWRYQLMICYNFTITLFLFPGLFAVIPSMHGNELQWFPVILISIFQVLDFVGKTIPAKWPSIFSERALYVLAASRIVYFPLFLFCVHPRIFTHDAIPIIIAILFSLSNGYVGAVTMMLAPGKVETHERDLAGTIMSFSLVLGLTIGASLGWTLSWFL